MAILIYFSASLGASHLIYNFLRRTVSFLSYLELASLTQLVALVVGTIALMGFTNLHTAEMRARIWGVKNRWRSFLKGAGFCLVLYPIVMVIVQLIQVIVTQFGDFPRNDQVALSVIKSLRAVPWLFWSFVVIIVTVVPFVEELLFRGFIQNFLVDYLGEKIGIGCASCIFAAFHYSPSQGIANIELMAGLFFMSYLIGIVYLREKSLFATIGMHAIFNAIGIFLFFFSM
ncbi:MAG: conserved putative rane protein [Chlamydiia bacterium]|nr:conserved putative rane protein [Chlamydiia bacterium]